MKTKLYPDGKMKSLRYLSMAKSVPPHGTRASYVKMKCRCAECKEANNGWARERTKRKYEMAAQLTPSGPPIEGTIERGRGPEHAFLCPGVEGKSCVRTPAAWLRAKTPFCATCAERATVWNGLISAARAKRHILKLSRAGIGYKSINEASGVARQTIWGITKGLITQIRRESETRILAVTKEAYAGGHVIDATEGNKIIAKMRARGMLAEEIARALGYQSNNVSDLGRRARMTVKTLMNIQRAWRKIEAEDAAKALAERIARGEVERAPSPDTVPHDWLDDAGDVLPQFRNQVARLRAQLKRAA